MNRPFKVLGIQQIVIGGEGVLIDLVQALPEIIVAH